MAGPGCPKDGFKGVQDGVKAIHAQLLWEIWATPHVIKCCTGQCFMMQNASGGVVHCIFIKQRPCGPLARAFFQKGQKQKKGYPNTSRASEKNRALSTHKIHSYREGANACLPPAIAQTNCISASASLPCSQTKFAACLGEGCNALNHIVQVMCMQVLKKVGTHLQGGSQALEIVRMGSVKLH